MRTFAPSSALRGALRRPLVGPAPGMLACALALSGAALAADPVGVTVTAVSLQDQQEAPAAEEAPLALRAKRVLVAPGKVIEDGVVLVKRGRIVAVGADVAVPEGARVLEGEVVCAGFIDPWSDLGVDAASMGDGRTDAATRVTDALDPWGSAYARREAVAAGVLLTRAQAGTSTELGGIGAVVRNGAEGDDLVLLADANVAAAVGLAARGRAKDPFDRIGEADKLASKLAGGRDYRADWTEYETKLAEWEAAIAAKEKDLDKDFKKAQKARDKDIEDAKKKGEEHKEKEYKEDKRPRAPKYDEEKEVLARVVAGELPLVVRCEGSAELRALLAGTAEFPRLRMWIVGGTGAELVAQDLATRHIAVVVQPTPFSELDGERPEGHDLGLAARLAARGVDVLLGSGGPSRDLPLMAALAVGHGFDAQVAFHALTVGAARALDVAGEVGTVEVGKRAELLLLDGDPLTSAGRVRAAISAGRVVHETTSR
ncbi:MAG: hypothetical protein R3F49_16495 [Planctomycetota bacterium]